MSHRVGGLGDGESAADLSGTTTVHDSVVADQVACDADGVVQGALGLVDDHLVATANKDGNGPALLVR